MQINWFFSGFKVHFSPPHSGLFIKLRQEKFLTCLDKILSRSYQGVPRNVCLSRSWQDVSSLARVNKILLVMARCIKFLFHWDICNFCTPYTVRMAVIDRNQFSCSNLGKRILIQFKIIWSFKKVKRNFAIEVETKKIKEIRSKNDNRVNRGVLMSNEIV